MLRLSARSSWFVERDNGTEPKTHTSVAEFEFSRAWPQEVTANKLGPTAVCLPLPRECQVSQPPSPPAGCFLWLQRAEMLGMLYLVCPQEITTMGPPSQRFTPTFSHITDRALWRHSTKCRAVARCLT